MLTAVVKAKLVIFAIVALLATSYLGARYVGVNLTGSGYDVTVSMSTASGAFENGEVTYRGVPVGRIADLRVTDQGMEAVLHIDAGAPEIPADSLVRVVDRSVIGEQYIDLHSETAGGPALGDGARLEAGPESAPPAIDEVLRSARDFAGSVDQESLRTVIDEGYEATRGGADHLSRLLETSQDFVETADSNFLVTAGLIENSTTVLSTQEASAASIRGFSRDLSTIATTLQSSDGDLRQLIASSPAAARALDKLFKQVGTPLGILMGNLVSTAQVFGTNAAGVEDALIRVPEAVSIGWAINGSQGINLGLAQTYFDPLPCTSGYGGTDLREGLEASTGEPFNTDAGCTAAPSSGTDVRGPRSVPKKAGATALMSPSERATARVTVVDSLSDLLGGAQ